VNSVRVRASANVRSGERTQHASDALCRSESKPMREESTHGQRSEAASARISAVPDEGQTGGAVLPSNREPYASEEDAEGSGPLRGLQSADLLPRLSDALSRAGR